MKRLRRLAACCALFAICFVQLAMAAHACMVMAATDRHVPCAEMGMAGTDDRPALCLEHCKGNQQLVDHHSPVPIAAPVVTPITVTDVGDAIVAISPVRFPLGPATPIPVFAASSRLRI